MPENWDYAKRQLNSKKYPLTIPIKSENRQLLSVFRKVGASLEKQFPEKFVSLLFLGSPTKGYAKRGSDIDYRFVVNNASNIDLHNIRDYARSLFNEHDKLLRSRDFLGTVDVGNTLRHLMEFRSSPDNDERILDRIASDFAIVLGLASGKKIGQARALLVNEAEKLPEPYKSRFWELARQHHLMKVVLPSSPPEFQRRVARSFSKYLSDSETRAALIGRVEKFGIPEDAEKRKEFFKKFIKGNGFKS